MESEDFGTAFCISQYAHASISAYGTVFRLRNKRADVLPPYRELRFAQHRTSFVTREADKLRMAAIRHYCDEFKVLVAISEKCSSASGEAEKALLAVMTPESQT
jgi:hypothetical protein